MGLSDSQAMELGSPIAHRVQDNQSGVMMQVNLCPGPKYSDSTEVNGNDMECLAPKIEVKFCESGILETGPESNTELVE
jgi:hypothetical protein